jgi:ribosomal protein S6--L-glutamate ligase
MTEGTLYFLHEGTAGDGLARRAIVAAAAERAGIGFMALDSLTCDYVNLPILRPSDMLFNAGRGSVRLETLLWRPDIGTFRTCGAQWFTNGGDTTAYCAMLMREGLSTPRTYHRLPPNNDDLPGIVKSLGGFPLVVKAGNGTLGIGVMLIESMRSLRGVLDFLRTTEQEFILREFIEPLHIARLVVLGGKVICSVRYAIPDDDFRGLPYRMGGQPMAFGPEVEDIAIAASKACRHQFTGVDIIIDKARKPYVLEVNPPSNFVALERDMGIPVGDMIVGFLIENAKEKSA